MKKVLIFLKNVEKLLLIIPFTLLCLLIVIEIFLRTVFYTGLPWLEELGRFILVFGTFFGAGIAVSANVHPRMTAILVAVPCKIRQILMALGNLICLSALILIDGYAWLQIGKMAALGTMTSTMPIPMYIVYLIIPLGLASMAVRFAICLANDLKLFPKSLSEVSGNQ